MTVCEVCGPTPTTVIITKPVTVYPVAEALPTGSYEGNQEGGSGQPSVVNVAHTTVVTAASYAAGGYGHASSAAGPNTLSSAIKSSSLLAGQGSSSTGTGAPIQGHPTGGVSPTGAAYPSASGTSPLDFTGAASKTSAGFGLAVAAVLAVAALM